jgi:hypothetical protein
MEMEMEKTLAYFNTATITAAKWFIIRAPGRRFGLIDSGKRWSIWSKNTFYIEGLIDPNIN